jgi:hypothetical protein
VSKTRDKLQVLAGPPPQSAKWGGLSFGDFSLANREKLLALRRRAKSSALFEPSVKAETIQKLSDQTDPSPPATHA